MTHDDAIVAMLVRIEAALDERARMLARRIAELEAAIHSELFRNPGDHDDND